MKITIGILIINIIGAFANTAIPSAPIEWLGLVNIFAAGVMLGILPSEL